jgi:hypothetical protein
VNSKEDESAWVAWLRKFVSENPRYFRVGHLVLGIILLVWPYIFVGAVWGQKSQGGLQASDRITRVVRDKPSSVVFFGTAVVVVISAVMTYLFTTALMCVHLDKKKPGIEGGEAETMKGEDSAVEEKKSGDESPLMLFYQTMKGNPDEWPVAKVAATILKQEKYTALYLVAILLLYMGIFTFVSPGLNAILLPHPFSLLRPLQGYELDFSSNDTTCVEWVVSHPIPETCNWREHNGFQFTDCLGENQLVDVLEAGRSSMRALVAENDTLNTLTFTQLGGVSFQGPIHGVFPIGPNGIPGFDTLQTLPQHIFQSAPWYNYTVDLQGISSDVHCQYDTSTPISTIPMPGQPVALFNASCPTGDTLPDFTPYPVPHISVIGNNTLGAWPCKSSSPGNSYVIYLNGSGNYANVVGNMTCTVSLLQPSIFNVTYNSTSKLFSAHNTSRTTSNSTVSVFDRSVSGVLNSIIEAQNFGTNLIVESVITYAVKDLNISESQIFVQDDRYLQLFQALIQGMLEYEAAYTRMIFLSLSPPPGCRRKVGGNMWYEVVGWDANIRTAGYLLPLTLINLSSIVILLVSIINNPNPISIDFEDLEFYEPLQAGAKDKLPGPAEDAFKFNFKDSLALF